jgi:hypothetical protein
VANLSTLELLQPQVIVDTISKIHVGKGPLSRLMKWEIGSGSIKQIPTRFASFRIFNQTRAPATFRAPGTGPAVITPNPVGEQRFMMARMHEKMVFGNEFLGNISKIGGPNAEIDKGGAEYVAEQMQYVAHRFNRGVEVITAGFFRGNLYLQNLGQDQLLPALSAPSGAYITIPFGLPAGNTLQLNMLGTGNIIDISWASPASNIIKHILQVRSAMVQLTGLQLKCLVMSSVTFNYVINNISVRTVGGLVQTPFDYYTMDVAKDEKGVPIAGLMRANIRAIPWIDIYIVDDVLSLGGDLDYINTGNNVGTLTQVVPDNYVIFMPEPSTVWAQMCHGGEYIAENEAVSSLQLKTGLSAWKSFTREPSAMAIVSLLNLLPVPYLEKAWCYGQIAGF